jgi:hypothetical protein
LHPDHIKVLALGRPWAHVLLNQVLNKGFKLKKVQVTPGSFDSIMHAAAWFPAFRARKFTAGFKIYMNIELPSFNAKIH